MEGLGCVRAHGKHQRVGHYRPYITLNVVHLPRLYTSAHSELFCYPCSEWFVWFQSFFLCV